MKKEIVKRLIEAGHIDFDEALILMETEKQIVYLPRTDSPLSPPWQPFVGSPIQPFSGNPNPYTYTADN